MLVYGKDVLLQWYKSQYRNKKRSSFGQPSRRCQRFLDHIGKQISPKDALILELGVGDGRNIIELVRNNYNIVGVDRVFAPRTAAFQIDYIISDIESYKIDCEKYDAIICTETLHMISRNDIGPLLACITQGLTKGGIVFCDLLCDIKRWHQDSGIPFVWQDEPAYSSAEARQLLENFSADLSVLVLGEETDGAHWPLDKVDDMYPVPPYTWQSKCMFLMAQK